MKSIIATFCYFISCIAITFSQKLEKEYKLGKILHRCNEPAISINPIQPQYEIIAANTNHVFYKKRIKRKFNHQLVKSSHGVYGDPVLLYDKSGHCYFVHLSKAAGKSWPESFDCIVVQKSTNNGSTWNDGVAIGRNGKMQDKAWISIDEFKTSPYANNVYISWTEFDAYESRNPDDSSRILFSYSKDKGENFSKPIKVNDRNGNCLDKDETVEGATTCVNTHGEIFIAWAAYEKVFLDKSIDGGNTFGEDKIIMEIPKGWELDVPHFFRTNSLPFIASDSNGNMAVCAGMEENSYNKVVYTQSLDGGNTWSKRQIVYDIDSTHTFMPHLYIDKSTNRIYILYYKVKGIYTDIILSYKHILDREFKHLRVNQYSFILPGKRIFMGDYINLSAVGNKVSCVWTQPNIGNQYTQIRTRNIIFSD